MSMLLLTSIQVVACCYVLFICCVVLNRMNKHTRNTVRWSYLALAGGAFAGIISEPTISGMLYSSGFAIYLACNDRRSSIDPKSPANFAE